MTGRHLGWLGWVAVAAILSTTDIRILFHLNEALFNVIHLLDLGEGGGLVGLEHTALIPAMTIANLGPGAHWIEHSLFCQHTLCCCRSEPPTLWLMRILIGKLLSSSKYLWLTKTNQGAPFKSVGQCPLHNLVGSCLPWQRQSEAQYHPPSKAQCWTMPQLWHMVTVHPALVSPEHGLMSSLTPVTGLTNVSALLSVSPASKEHRTHLRDQIVWILQLWLQHCHWHYIEVFSLTHTQCYHSHPAPLPLSLPWSLSLHHWHCLHWCIDGRYNCS